MRLKPDAAWSPFTAEQRFTASPPGFVWDATVRMMPLVPVRVRDSYVAGEGRMLGRIAGVVTVVNQGGTSEMKLGALARAKPSSSERFGVLEHHLAREACGLTMLGLGVRPADARQSQGVRIPPLTPSGNLARYAATTHCITAMPLCQRAPKLLPRREIVCSATARPQKVRQSVAAFHAEGLHILSRILRVCCIIGVRPLRS